jgi:hypothetical protein
LAQSIEIYHILNTRPKPISKNTFTKDFQKSMKSVWWDVNVRVCFMSAGEINQEAIREVHSTKSIGCFIKKPIMIDNLIERLKPELE